MAEALALLGLAACIVQFADVSARIIERLNEIRSSGSNVTGIFHNIEIQLQLLRNNLQKTKEQIDAGQVDTATQDGLNAVVEGCLLQAARVDAILTRIAISKDDSKLRKGMKIVLSIRQEDEVKEITRCIEGYVLHLIHHQALSIRASLPARPTLQRTPSFSTVPYPRDPNFTGRSNQLQRLTELLQPGNRAALYGLGGIGYRFLEMNPAAIVLWVYASSIARVDEAYKEIARRAQLDGFDDPSVSKMQLVSDWLQEEASGSWLMVIDNADFDDTFYKPISSLLSSGVEKSVVDFVPSAPNGRALITSRNRAVATKLAHRSRIVEVPSFTETEGRGMLQSAIGMDKLGSEEEVRQLLEKLEHLPLAISQAAAFIDENDITIAEYLAILEDDDHDFINVLTDSIEDSRRDRDSLNSVIASWKLSFDYLRSQQPHAAELLSLMSMLDVKSVPECLILSGKKKDFGFIKGMGSLKSFSLVIEDPQKKEYTVHRLVHLATRAWIETDGDTQYWRKRGLEAVDKVYPAGEVDQWRECSELEPHAQAVLAFAGNDDKDYQAHMADLLIRSGRDRYNQYDFATAHARFSRALALREGLCDSDSPPDAHLSVALCCKWLAWCHFAKKEFQMAVAAAEKALSIYERHSGSEAKETLQMRSNIAKFLTKAGDWDKAYGIQVAILKQQREKLGERHEDVLYTMSRMVNTLRKQKKLDEALELSTKVVALRSEVSGRDHHTTLNVLANHADLLQSLGRTEQAVAEMWEVYNGHVQKFGKDHHDSKEDFELIQEYQKEAEERKKTDSGECLVQT